MTGDAVPEQIRLSIEALPAIAEALECCLGAYRAAYRAAMVVAGCDEPYGDEALCDDLIGRSGAGDLGQMLQEVAGRLGSELGIDMPEWYPRRSREEAAGMLSTIAGWYGVDKGGVMTDEVTLCEVCHQAVDPDAAGVVRAVKPRYDEQGPLPDLTPSLFHESHLPPGWRLVAPEA